jgi:hypothetical protein
MADSPTPVACTFLLRKNRPGEGALEKEAMH